MGGLNLLFRVVFLTLEKWKIYLNEINYYRFDENKTPRKMSVDTIG